MPEENWYQSFSKDVGCLVLILVFVAFLVLVLVIRLIATLVSIVLGGLLGALTGALGGAVAMLVSWLWMLLESVTFVGSSRAKIKALVGRIKKLESKIDRTTDKIGRLSPADRPAAKATVQRLETLRNDVASECVRLAHALADHLADERDRAKREREAILQELDKYAEGRIRRMLRAKQRLVARYEREISSLQNGFNVEPNAVGHRANLRQTQVDQNRKRLQSAAPWVIGIPCVVGLVLGLLAGFGYAVDEIWK